MNGVIVVGAGYWGEKYIEYLNEIGQLRLVVESDKERALQISYEYDVSIVDSIEHTSIGNLESQYDGVIICTPPDSHVDTALFFLAKGKYVLIEKPLGTSYDEALKLYSYRDKCFGGLVYLHNPMIHSLKSICDVNDVNHLYIRRTNDGPVRPWQSVMWDLAPHDISISNHIMGSSPIDSKSICTRDWCVIDLIYLGGPHTVIYNSWLGGPKTRIIEMVLNNSDESNGARITFDEMSYVYETPPLKIMIDDFLTGGWDESSYIDSLSIVKLIENLDVV